METGLNRRASIHRLVLDSIGSAFVLVMLLAALPLGAQPAPYHHYRTLDTPHFRVTVPDGLEREGRVAGAYAERAYELLARELHTPRGRIDLVVSDDADYSNGYATPVPTNRIVVFATPPIESNALRLNEDWLQLVITHELAHIFHLDRSRGLWRVAQAIFGRAPALFPNRYGPSWLTEGLAVYYESRLTQGGRLRDAEHRQLANVAAREQRFPELNELSLGSPVFPGGERAYAYGSLFVEYLARTYGDTNVGNFVEHQSNTIIPFRLNADAEHTFGVGIEYAYAKWRDSLTRVAGKPFDPIKGWRELTSHPFYAIDPRWVNDSLLVYSGSDGRSTPGEFTLTLQGERHRTGRRNTIGPNVPLTGGGLLFAQLEYVGTAEVRSDLYIERNGTQRRLTHDMRLVQPDARADGTIVAAQVDATRSSLILLDATARESRLLRDAGPDETWSDPRWAPDGRSIAVVHRKHGGIFTLEEIDIATGASEVIEGGHFILSSPSWTRSGKHIYYVSERDGIPELRAVCRTEVSVRRPADTAQCDAPLVLGANINSSDEGPGLLLAASALRSDGFHIGVAPLARATPLERRVTIDTAGSPLPEPLAPGEFHRYSALRGVLPRYWYPVLEAAPGRGERLGASSSGSDILNRHLWDGFVAIPTTGMFPTGRLTYRYAGLRRPFIDLDLSQSYDAELELTNGGTGAHIGTLLRRTQSAALATSFARPRFRTYSALAVGAQVERRSFVTDPDGFLRQLDTTYARDYVFPSVFVGGQWSNLQRPALSISPEDGIALAFTVRDRWRSDITSQSNSVSFIGTAAGYKSLNLPGFAHHVLALRIAGGVADRKAASSFQVGGVSGTSIQIIPGYSVGEGRRTFGVRGFAPATVYGTSAATGTLEYRMPVQLAARGRGVLPFFADRSSVSAFVDAGVANCVNNPYVLTACAPPSRLGKPIGSVGLEVVQSAAIFDYDTPQNIRVGLAVPVVGRGLVSTPVITPYIAYGLSF